MLTSITALGAFILVISGCASAPRPSYTNDAIAREILAAEADGELSLDSETPLKDATVHKIPIEINERVNSWIEFFSVRDRERFHRFLKRGAAYKQMVQATLKDHNVPREIYYLAMIESGYATHATSTASAVGIWQFIRGTGKRYGLKTDRYIDERRNPILATKAAARYLTDLHRMFNSWYLAMAGYNAGEYRIIGAIRKGNTRDFWELADRGVLPKETMNYIPKFMAAVIIGRNPEKFGFTDIEPDTTFPELERIEVSARYNLRAVANTAGLDHEELKRLNPQLKLGWVPTSYKTYTVWLPKERIASFQQNKRLLAKYATPQREIEPVRHASLSRVSYRSTARETKSRTQHYRVRRGDTLHGIAERFGVQVSALKKLNGLRRNKIYSGQALRIASSKI